MGNVKWTVTEKQLLRYDLVSMVLVIMLSLYSVVIGFFYFNKPSDVRELRQQLREVQGKVEKGDYTALNDYHAMVVDTKGSVVFSNLRLYREGEKVNLHLLSYGGAENESTKHYITPLVTNEVQTGTLYLEYEEQYNRSYLLAFLVPLVLLFVILLILFLRTHFIHNDIVIPIVHLNQLAQEISRGNYKVKYTYETGNEIGKLCRKIEALRDELDISTENEKKLRENEKMLLASISHDLKTPIATISGFAEGIRDGIAKDEATITQYANTIIKKAGYLTKLVNDIIENTACEVNTIVLHKKELLANEYIEEVLAMLLPDLDNKGLHLVKTKLPDALIVIDPDKMYQVFQNIIGNSIKYTESGGTITIKAVQRVKDIAITLQDDGQGIAAEDIPYVFNRFYRGEKARTQNIAGCGLGLSIVKNIVEEHGGIVECESELGEGTAISFTIPLA